MNICREAVKVLGLEPGGQGGAGKSAWLEGATRRSSQGKRGGSWDCSSTEPAPGRPAVFSADGSPAPQGSPSTQGLPWSPSYHVQALSSSPTEWWIRLHVGLSVTHACLEGYQLSLPAVLTCQGTGPDWRAALSVRKPPQGPPGHPFACSSPSLLRTLLEGIE